MQSGTLSLRSIRSVSVLLPGFTARRWQCGGLQIARKFARLLNATVPARVVTYVDREPDTPYLDDLPRDPAALFVITWGPHARELIGRLQGRQVAYYAQSVGWVADLPLSVPILCLSRYIMTQWAQRAPYNHLFLVSPILEPECRDAGRPRDIDVLLHERKSSRYLRDHLVPQLRRYCEVYALREFVAQRELFELYNRSRVYLYATGPLPSGGMEGFGMQPLEALVCGCSVFSTLHGGLADYLEPELNAFQLETHSLEHDIMRILKAVRQGPPQSRAGIEALRQTYSEEAFHERARAILLALDEFFAGLPSLAGDIARRSAIDAPPAWRAWLYAKRRGFARQWHTLLRSRS